MWITVIGWIAIGLICWLALGMLLGIFMGKIISGNTQEFELTSRW